MAVSRQRFTNPSSRTPKGLREKLWGKNQNTTSFQNKRGGIGPISNSIMLIVLACILGLLYLTQVTKTNSYGYRTHALQQQQAQLKEEHSELEVESARLQALERVKNSEVAKNLISVAPTGTVQN
jgi:hypothetical protein